MASRVMLGGITRIRMLEIGWRTGTDDLRTKFMRIVLVTNCDFRLDLSRCYDMVGGSVSFFVVGLLVVSVRQCGFQDVFILHQNGQRALGSGALKWCCERVSDNEKRSEQIGCEDSDCRR